VLRLLTKLPREQWKEAWQAAIDLAGDAKITVRHVQRAIQNIVPRQPLEPSFGEALDFPGLRRAPINELGVVFLFGLLSKQLGFDVEAVHSGFPDCSAKRLVDLKRNRWKQIRIEFEYSSRNFRLHQHDDDDCDVIVCWIHDWPECPIEVIALKDTIMKSTNVA
jgi:hypothetical protein